MRNMIRDSSLRFVPVVRLLNDEVVDDRRRVVPSRGYRYCISARISGTRWWSFAQVPKRGLKGAVQLRSKWAL